MRNVAEARTKWTLADFLLLGLAWGFLGGLLEAILRLWLQSSGGTNFEMRLTAISPSLLWVAPLSYAALFTLVGFGCWLGQRLIGLVDWIQVAMVAAGGLALLGPIAASGRIATPAVLLLATGLGVAANRFVSADAIRRRTVVRRVLAGLVAAVIVGAAAAEFVIIRAERRALEALPVAAPNAPNVIVVIFDTLRADRLSSYGYSQATSPTLSLVAKQGVQFDWAIAASSWSLPSHVSMLTGRLPTDHGAEIHRYDGRFPFVSEAFQKRGYLTAAISANSSVFSRAQGFDTGFSEFDDSFYSPVDGFTRTVLGRQIHKAVSAMQGRRFHPVRRPAEAVTRAAQKWIERHGDRPFFLVLNYFDVHDAIQTTTSDSDSYDALVAYVDQWFGELWKYLSARGLADNTVLAVTSDHGESLGQHGWAAHGTSLNIEQIHVPLILRFPPAVPVGVRVSVPVSHTSLPVTLLELAGGSGPEGVLGPSLVPLYKNLAVPPPWPLPVAELRYRPWTSKLEGQDALTSVLDFPWHYIHHSMGEHELFNLRDDPGETRNLARSEEHSTILGRYQKEIERISVRR